MPAIQSMGYVDHVAHIVGTYGISLPREVLTSARTSIHEPRAGSQRRFAEEEAAIFLARHLHGVVTDALRSATGHHGDEGVLDVWSRFVQQALYRTELGFINRLVFGEEILPLIDDVERMVRERERGDDCSVARTTAPGSGAAE